MSKYVSHSWKGFAMRWMHQGYYYNIRGLKHTLSFSKWATKLITYVCTLTAATTKCILLPKYTLLVVV